MSVYLAVEGQATTQEVQLLRNRYPVCAKGSPGPVGTSADQGQAKVLSALELSRPWLVSAIKVRKRYCVARSTSDEVVLMFNSNLMR
jgi:hypothetical protein